MINFYYRTEGKQDKEAITLQANCNCQGNKQQFFFKQTMICFLNLIKQFPWWEYFVPLMGIYYSHDGNN